MQSTAITDRIMRIQRHLNLKADGIIGADTLTAIENGLFSKASQLSGPYSLTISRSGMEQLIDHEVVSKHYYNRYLKNPVWPGGSSGVTIGIGYDLGYNRSYQIEKDWAGKLSDTMLAKLVKVAGLKAAMAKAAISSLKTVEIDFDQASEVFSESTLPRYAEATLKAYPGVEDLYADAQAALLSLVYNRGTAMSGSRRKEMAAIRPLVQAKNYSGIAQEIINMKRLWLGKGLDGLLKRRDAEASMVLNSMRNYKQTELVRV